MSDNIHYNTVVDLAKGAGFLAGFWLLLTDWRLVFYAIVAIVGAIFTLWFLSLVFGLLHGALIELAAKFTDEPVPDDKRGSLAVLVYFVFLFLLHEYLMP